MARPALQIDPSSIQRKEQSHIAEDKDRPDPPCLPGSLFASVPRLLSVREGGMASCRCFDVIMPYPLWVLLVFALLPVLGSLQACVFACVFRNEIMKISMVCGKYLLLGFGSLNFYWLHVRPILGLFFKLWRFECYYWLLQYINYKICSNPYHLP